ncbi:hypothetical protein ASE16_17075 [Leifsonia sp. Root227]|uniref:hypothetical protein n=1 Tax=Leifsonia sp. Root227 TaxID=1736496 RepID=UPI0007012AF6|nr:hypothetical protein [Leifsonia sp. Root227]KRC47078.1 hypothetical protein ASE16_17075 [Leifsonia sp. Root227]
MTKRTTFFYILSLAVLVIIVSLVVFLIPVIRGSGNVWSVAGLVAGSAVLIVALAFLYVLRPSKWE